MRKFSFFNRLTSDRKNLPAAMFQENLQEINKKV